MIKHSPFCYIKLGPGFLHRLVQVHGLGTMSNRTIVYRAPTFALPITLLWLSWHWMVLLGPWSLAQVRGPRQDGPATPGWFQSSEMESILSLESAIKSLVRSQVVLSDSAPF